MQKGQETYTDKDVLINREAYDELVLQNRELRAENLYLKQELAHLKRMIFGSKSERHIGSDPSQLNLGLDAETVKQPEKATEQLTYTREKPDNKKGSAIRLSLPAHLHREEHIIEPQEDITGARKIGEVVTEVLEYTPGKFYVERYVRPKYVFPKEERIVIGELPSLPIPRGNAGAGLLAHLLISKFIDHLPFYRQVQQFKRQDIDIAESTISGWFTASCRLLEPLYERLKKRVQESSYLMADETPIPVQTKDKPGSTHKGYHWVYYAPREKLVCFDYRKGRGREGPDEFLEHFRGMLQTDGYDAYDIYEKKEGVTLYGCMAHARRKFEKAKDNDPKRAEYVLGRMQDLYTTEREARENNLSPDERKELRVEQYLPILLELEKWMKEQYDEVLPKSSIGQAINYTKKLWPRLSRFIQNGLIEIDNNLIENSIRPVALGYA
ncbi:MAG TPA: IS66 family transposase [Bacteroidales bacterium]|jgi:transposase|nr:IS66 family transposase [Bacteroidales bacterium]OQB59753.1 MAG: Transposase IS66 family protein [Bacteroidetes bacterium ADurb.Bin145]HQK69437.1 IS66 family transposase [Bacteroidales bacterium]